MKANFDNKPQPSTSLEKGAVAREVMGLPGEDGGEHVRAPRFHRMSIAAAQNGVSIDHEHPPKPSKKGGDSPSFHQTKPFVASHDHPIMKHIQAIHDHVSKDCPDCNDHDADDK